MDTNKQQLVDAINAVLNNPSESLCYCDEGWIAVQTDWAEQYRDEYVILGDGDWLVPDASEGYSIGELADWCEERLLAWLQESLDDELDSPEPDEDRVAMLREVLK